MSRRARGLALAALALLYLLCLRAYYVGFFNDDAFYVFGARSLLQGRYVELGAPGTPPMVNYPPGYPLLLAPIALAAGQALLPYQLLSVALATGAAALAWLVFEGAAAPAVLAAATAVFAVNPLAASLSGTVLSEVPYLFFTLLMLLLARRSWTREEPRVWLGLGALAGFCFLLRTTGACAALALTGCLLLERRARQAALCAAGAALVGLPYLLRNRLLSGYGELRFFEWLEPYRGAPAQAAASLASAVKANAVFYAHELFWRDLFRWPDVPGGPLLRAATAAAALFLLARGLRAWGLAGWRKLLPAYLGLYAVVHLLWAMQTGRYVYPVLAPLAALMLLGAERALGRRAALATAALSLALAAPGLGRLLTASLTQRTRVNTPPERTHAFLRAAVKPGEIVAAEIDGRLQLLTGLPVVHLRRLREPAEFRAWLAAANVRYVLVDPALDVTRTPSGRMSNDAMPESELRALLAGAGARSVFADAAEGLEVFKVQN